MKLSKNEVNNRNYYSLDGKAYTGKIEIMYENSKNIKTIGYILNEVPISESELIKQIEELFKMDKKMKRMSINLCDRWLERLKSGVKVKEL